MSHSADQQADFRDWIASARTASVRDELVRRGLWSDRMAAGGWSSGMPCPGCGGRDRFSVNISRNAWYCRKSQIGGDAIALAEHIDGSDFLRAVETVTGAPNPQGREAETEEERREREAKQRLRLARLEREAARSRQKTIDWRERERARAYRIWCMGAPIGGTLAASYLAGRGLTAPPHARLRFIDQHEMWAQNRVIHRGPAMIGAIVGPDGVFSGVHQTWLDAKGPKGKAFIVDPETGLVEAAKKTRGSWKGGRIPLAPHAEPKRTFLGEGIETVLAVYAALKAAALPLTEQAEFHSGVNLGNLSGLAENRVKHPSLRIAKRDGRDGGAQKVPGATPKAPEDDYPVIFVPPSVTDLWLLGDGDSDPFVTGLALQRAAARFARRYPQLTVRLAMADAGADFADMLLRAGVE